MMPMLSLIIMIFSLINLMLMNSFLYYFFNYIPIKNHLDNSLHYKNWNWKW